MSTGGHPDDDSDHFLDDGIDDNGPYSPTNPPYFGEWILEWDIQTRRRRDAQTGNGYHTTCNPELLLHAWSQPTEDGQEWHRGMVALPAKIYSDEQIRQGPEISTKRELELPEVLLVEGDSCSKLSVARLYEESHLSNDEVPRRPDPGQIVSFRDSRGRTRLQAEWDPDFEGGQWVVLLIRPRDVVSETVDDAEPSDLEEPAL